MSCKTPFKSSEANGKSWMRTQGVIDQYRNILDYPSFINKNLQLKDAGSRKYGIVGTPFRVNDTVGDTMVAIPNKEYFQAIDFINNPKVPIEGSNQYLDQLYEDRLTKDIAELSFDEEIQRKIDIALNQYKGLQTYSNTQPPTTERPYLNVREIFFKGNDTVSTVEMLENIISFLSPNNALHQLAIKLLPYAKEINIPVHLVEKIVVSASASGGKFFKEGEATGEYDHRYKVIRISESRLSNPGFVTTALHEIMHSLTFSRIRNRSSSSAVYFRSLYEYATTQLSKDDEYALLNEDEFIVALFVNPSFIKKLQEIPALRTKKFNNLFEEIFTQILRVLGISKRTEPTLYEEAFSVATNILEEERADNASIREKMSEMDAILSQDDGFIANDEDVAYAPIQSTRKVNFPTGNFNAYKKEKEGQLRRINNKIFDLKGALKKAQGNTPAAKARFKAISNKIADLTQLADNLTTEIADISSISDLNPIRIDAYIKTDIRRLNSLNDILEDPNANTREKADARDEIKRILDFFDQLTNFEPEKINKSGHPIYTTNDIFDPSSGGKILNQDIDDYFSDLKRKLEPYKTALGTHDIKLVEELFNRNPLIQGGALQGRQYADIVHGEEGLKDLNWWDTWLMDIGQNTFNPNGVLSQVIHSTVQQKFWEEEQWSKNRIEEIDVMLPEVIEEMKRLGNKAGVLGIIRGISWDLFKQVYPNKQETGNMVDKYSAEYYDEYQRARGIYHEELDKARLGFMTFDQVFNNRKKWFEENTIEVDVSLMEELITEFPTLTPLFSTNRTDIDKQKADLIAVIGDKHYANIVESQKRKVNEYMAAREREVEKRILAEGVANEAALSFASRSAISKFEHENSPFKAAEYERNGGKFLTTFAANLRPNYFHTTYIPKTTGDVNGLNYYDANYAEIEANPILYKFHTLMSDTLKEIKNKLGNEAASKMSFNNLLNLEKGVADILLDKDMSFLQKISASLRKIIENIKQMLGVRIEGAFSYSEIDPDTGKPVYKINDEFIYANKKKIEEKKAIADAEFMDAFNNSASNTNAPQLLKIRVVNGREYIHFNDPRVLALVSKYTGKTYTNIRELYADYGQFIPIGKIIDRYAKNEVAKEKSFDLPKVIKTYTYLAAMYHARVQMQPSVELLKEHFDKIQDVETTNTGQTKKKQGATGPVSMTTGERENAKKQMEFFFQKTVLGNENLKEFGIIASNQLPPVQGKTMLTRTLGNFVSAITNFDGKMYTKYEKDMVKNIDQILQSKTLDPGERDRLLKVKERLGKNFAFSRLLDAMLHFIRFKGLSYSLSSNLTNFLEGQLANKLLSGQYFPPEYLYEVTPMDLLALDSISKVSMKKVPQKALVAKLFAKKLDLLQDATNELQKSSAKTGITGSERLKPMYGTRKTEEYNQIPIIAAIMKDTPITKADGTTGDLLDALEAYETPTGEWVYRLKQDYSTTANEETWENLIGDIYYKFKARASSIISNTHGRGYDQLRPMAAKGNLAGRSLLLFKTWLPTEVHKRFAVDQFDISTNTKINGRYRSHTGTSTAMESAIMGFMTLGVPGAIVGGLIGGLGANYFSKTHSSLSIIQENILFGKILFAKFAGIFLNPIARKVLKQGLEEKLIPSNSALMASMASPDFTETDLINLRANLQETAYMLAFMALMITSRALLMSEDEDDDEEEMVRKAMTYHLIVNRLTQLANNAMMFSSPKAMYETVTDMAIWRFYEEGQKVVEAVGKTLHGDSIVTERGPTEGQYRITATANKFLLPKLGNDIMNGDLLYLGFRSQVDRQFNPTPFDDWFLPEKDAEAKERTQNRGQQRAELRGEGELSEKEIEKQIEKDNPSLTTIKKMERAELKEKLKAEGLTNKEIGERMREYYSKKDKEE